jgi:aspartyl-tRNA(Asn)/glutamyl-tRNA(Gln) amidotransferase subunit B
MAGDQPKKIRINRIHMEEDAGKSLHGEGSQWSDIDYNRAGMPLLEIVTEPDIRSAEEAFAFVTSLRQLVRHLGVCDGNMEQGSLRCDVNISVRKKGDPVLGTKVEVKNLNSIRFIKKAIESESRRLMAMHAAGETILQQTRGLDETSFTTYPIRTKEDEDDYRYFPEPDLPPFFISEETIEEIRNRMPALPQETRKRLEKEFGLSVYDAAQIGDDPELSTLFFDMSALMKNYKVAANWIIGPVHQFMMAHDITLAEWGITAAPLARMIGLIEEGKISHNIAIQKVFPEIAAHPSMDVEAFVNDRELFVQTSSGDISQMIDAALSKHAQKIPEYKKGKKA